MQSNTRFGVVEWNGKLIHLTDDAQAENYGTDSDVRYYGHGVDDDGTRYKITWETTQAWRAMQEALGKGEEPAIDAPDPYDESLACDWDEPVDVKEC